MKKPILLSAIILLTGMYSFGQWWTTYLTKGTIEMGGATLGSKAYFAGGLIAPGDIWTLTNKVEIYDMQTQTWQLDNLAVARSWISGVTNGSNVFFAGGLDNVSTMATFDQVDIFNSLTGTWTSEHLSFPRFSVSAASRDSLVLFAGGLDIQAGVGFDVVDIYNTNTGAWTMASLSVPRGAMGCTVSGDRAFFAGGYDLTNWFDRVDIYNFTTGTWSTETLSLPRGFIGAANVGNKVLFAGGMIADSVPTDRVDIYDIQTGTWSVASLSEPRGFAIHEAVSACSKAYFVGGGIFDAGSWDTDSDVIDMYDVNLNQWTNITMPYRLNDHTVVAIDSSVLVAGGFTLTSPTIGIPRYEVEIFTEPLCVGVGIHLPQEEDIPFRVYPNPSSGYIQLELPDDNHQKPLQATIYNLQGQVVFTKTLEPGNLGLMVNLDDGVYLLNINSDDNTQKELITIQH